MDAAPENHFRRNETSSVTGAAEWCWRHDDLTFIFLTIDFGVCSATLEESLFVAELKMASDIRMSLAASLENG
jgi:hypothetical protein